MKSSKKRITDRCRKAEEKIKVLFLFSAVQWIHVISIFVVIERMKRVWPLRSEFRAKTVKTRVLGSSLSSSRPSAAILVSERSDRSRSDFFFYRLSELTICEGQA